MQNPQFLVRNSIETFERFWSCPITLRPMAEPVMTCDGHSFEREAIEQWLRINQRSPVTNLRLESTNLIPNHTLRNLIHRLNLQLSEYFICEENLVVELQSLKDKANHLDSELAKQIQYNQILKELIMDLKRGKQHEKHQAEKQKEEKQKIILQFENKKKELEQKIELLQQVNQLGNRSTNLNVNLQQKRENPEEYKDNQNEKKNKERKIYKDKEIGRVGQEKLIKMMKEYHEFPNLQTIYLSNNQIGAAGVKALAENPCKFPNLQAIDLIYNKISDAGLKALAENATKFPNLQTIDLRNNQIGDAGVKALTENASKFSSLKAIHTNSRTIKK